MIKTFKHDGLRLFFETGSKRGIQAAHATPLARQLAALNEATKPAAMNVPGWRLHSLDRKLKGHWSIWVNGD